MTRRAVTRERKEAAGRRSKPIPRAATRTGKKTASARAPMQAASKPAAPNPVALTPDSRKTAPARRHAAGRPEFKARPENAVDLEHEAGLDEARKDAAVRTEDDEDFGWLREDEDPRSQIVEDDDEWDPHHHEEW